MLASHRVAHSDGASSPPRQARPRRRRFWSDRAALAGLILVSLNILAFILAPWISPHPPEAQNMAARLKPPSETYAFGTDEYGRDVLSRVIWAARPSLTVGVLAVALAMPVGTLIGVLAGYKRGRFDMVATHLADTLLSIPSLILGLTVVAVLGPSTFNLIIAIALSLVPNFIRLARGPTIALAEREFVQAARALGVPEWRIIGFHILPNLVGQVMVMSTLYMATAIRAEASLSFLGLGIQPPTPSWGNMLRSGVDRILFAPWLAVYPGLAIVLAILGFNLLGDALRDALDPRLRKE